MNQDGQTDSEEEDNYSMTGRKRRREESSDSDPMTINTRTDKKK